MARHGENIRKRSDGRWEGRFLVYDNKREKKIYRSVYGHTYDEVREKLTIKKNLSANMLADTASINTLCTIHIDSMAEEWFIKVKNSRKLSTYIKYSTVYNNHIVHLFGKMPISEMTDAVVKEKIPDHLSKSIIKSIFCVLNQILKYAAQKYSISIPILKKPDMNKTSKPVVLSRSEQKKLVSVLHHEMDKYKTAVLFCLFTGLRIGELCALKWSDIDSENKVLVIRRTVQRLSVEMQDTKTALVETEPKSECSRREIPLSDSAVKLLVHNGKEYVFGSNKPLEPRTMQYHFKKILKEAGLDNKNFHILRHTFSTNCIEGGTDVKSLSEILGHADVKITLNRYVHPSMDTKRRYMNRISVFYGQISGQTG